MSAKLSESLKKRATRGEAHALIWALHTTFAHEFWIGGCCSLISSILQVTIPFTTRYLLAFADQSYLAEKTGTALPSLRHGISLAIGITIMQIVESACMNHFIYRGMTVGGQSRTVLIQAVFEKALKISARAKAEYLKDGESVHKLHIPAKTSAISNNHSAYHPFRIVAKCLPTRKPMAEASDCGWSKGKILNLMSVDSQRVNHALGMIHQLWTTPITIVIALILLCVNIGYSALSGFALLVVTMPLLTVAAKLLVKRRMHINKMADVRASLTYEILQTIRLIKFVGWENNFLKRLNDLRRSEISALQSLLTMRNAMNATSASIPVFASILAFVLYALTNHTLNVARIFSSLAIFSILRVPLTLLPIIISEVGDAYGAIQRIQAFVSSEDHIDDVDFDSTIKNAIEVSNACFTWERTPNDTVETAEWKRGGISQSDDKSILLTKKIAAHTRSTAGQEPFKLSYVDLSIGQGELVAVVGCVGSGKSSLLAALAGDMRKTCGTVKMKSSRSSFPQDAWIQNTTFKENILFGDAKPFDASWYVKVLSACALTQDLEYLPALDQTEIGERGINLSGGQKKRLALARVIYADTDIILIDDPFSAVDARVGKHIMDETICGMLRDKCIVLVTHNLSILDQCDRIIWMENGRIKAIDTLKTLSQGHPEFREQLTAAAEYNFDGDNAETTPRKIELEDRRAGLPQTAGALIQEEEMAVNSLKWAVWTTYIRASASTTVGSIKNSILLSVTLLLMNAANIATALWLSFWVSKKLLLSRNGYIGIYTVLGISQIATNFLFATLLSIFGTNASRNLFRQSIERVIRAPITFFDTTPLGRITNRFSKDVDCMDNTLTESIRMYLVTLSFVICVFTLVMVFFPLFAAALVPLAGLLLFSAEYYRRSGRQIKRFEAVLRSKVYAKFGESLSGAACIRLHGQCGRFSREMQGLLDDMNSAYFLTFSNQRWLSVRLDFIGNILVLIIGLLIVTSRFKVSPSISGVVLSYVLGIVQIIQFAVRQFAEVENDMNSTERLHHYTTINMEESSAHQTVVSDWPQFGEIRFTDVHLRYRTSLSPVLSGINLEILGGECMAVVGRTGAGKSTLLLALLRMIELERGSIRIDGVDISTISLHQLRTRLTIIPQDPTLFRGTIRSNLDPVSEHTDHALWKTLWQVGLVEPRPESLAAQKSSRRLHLDSIVEEEGSNYSVGQRQLISLARALLRDSKIILCDEATASLDNETDKGIRRTMMTNFRNKTVICIAHRLQSILAYDKVCIMDAGRVVDVGPPLGLYRKGGIFKAMCEMDSIQLEDFDKSNATKRAWLSGN